LMWEGLERCPIGPQGVKHQVCAAWSLRCVEPPLRRDAITQRRSMPRQVDLHRISLWWTVRGEKGRQVFVYGPRQRQHQQPRVTPMPDGLEFVDLAANVLRILRRVPGTLHIKFFAIARPRCAGLVYRSLKGNNITITIVENTGLGMIQGTLSPRM